MDGNDNLIVLILGAAGAFVASVFGGLKIGEWYKHKTQVKQIAATADIEKSKIEAAEADVINKLKLRVHQLELSMEMFLTIIKDEFTDKPNIQNIIVKVEEILNQKNE